MYGVLLTTLLSFGLADERWPVLDPTKLGPEDPTVACYVGGAVVDGPGQPWAKGEVSCEAGVFDHEGECGDYCAEFPEPSAYDEVWDPESDEHALALMNDALLWQERLEQLSRAKLPDMEAHTRTVNQRATALAKIANALLERWEQLTRRKHGPSKKSVRAMKKAWKDALQFAVELRDETDDE